MDSPTITAPAVDRPAHPVRPSAYSNELFIGNMAALYRKDPLLAQRIDDVPEADYLPIEPTRSGQVTTHMPTPSGVTYLHSRYDPVKEGEKLIDSVETSGRFGFVVLGFGLGYHVTALNDRLKGDAVIIVFEPCLPLLATAFSCRDFSDAISSGRLVFIDIVNKAVIHEKLKPHNTLMMLGAQFVMHAPSCQIAGDVHNEARKQITDLIAYSRMTLLTLVGNATITCQNIAHNLPRYLSTPPINILRDRFKGCPGIVISGGPSLRRNVELLAEAKGKAVLCCVQTTFKPLLARGIVPDYVTTLDFHAMSKQFFSSETNRDDVHLVAEPKVNWEVLDQYQGPVSLLYSPFAMELVSEQLAGRDGLQAGATVAHLAFYLAVYMGCDPIIFVGQDLAFTGHCFYMPGVEVHNTWQSEINRFNTMETREWERIVRNREILRKVPGVDGRELYTDDLLFTYREQFERDFINTSARIINATEGGAHMRGSEAMTLREAIDQYCTDPLPADSFSYRQQCDWNDTSRLESAGREIESRISEVQQIRDTCEKMLVVLHEMQGLTDDPLRFNQRIIQVDQLRSVIQRAQRAYRIVNASTQLAELQRYTADRKLSASDAAGSDRAERQLTRDVSFVESFRDGADKMVEILTTTLGRIHDHRREATR